MMLKKKKSLQVEHKKKFKMYKETHVKSSEIFW